MFPSDRFAAFVAHSLNLSAGDVCDIEPGHIYVSLLDALARRYAGSLLVYSRYASRMSLDEAASRYFAATVERAFWLSNKVEMSVAHRFFLALVRRRLGGAWKGAEIVRSNAAVAADPVVVALAAAGDLDAVVRQIDRLPKQVTRGNPAGTIRDRDGPLVLLVGVRAIELPEEMSLWHAIECSPRRLIRLTEGEPFNRFCGVIIDAMRTAHRPFLEVVGLGRNLCPFDWFDALSVNQVRGLRRFLARVEQGGAPDSRDAWSKAWDGGSVPGFRDLEALWSSEIGHALRQPNAPIVSVAIDEVADDALPPDVLGEEEFARELLGLQRDGVIASAERVVLERIYRGEELADMLSDPDVREFLRRRRTTLPVLVADLQKRIEAWNAGRD